MDYDGKLIGKWNKRRNQNEKCSQKLISWEMVQILHFQESKY